MQVTEVRAPAIPPHVPVGIDLTAKVLRSDRAGNRDEAHAQARGGKGRDELVAVAKRSANSFGSSVLRSADCSRNPHRAIAKQTRTRFRPGTGISGRRHDIASATPIAKSAETSVPSWIRLTRRNRVPSHATCRRHIRRSPERGCFRAEK